MLWWFSLGLPGSCAICACFLAPQECSLKCDRGWICPWSTKLLGGAHLARLCGYQLDVAAWYFRFHQFHFLERDHDPIALSYPWGAGGITPSFHMFQLLQIKHRHTHTHSARDNWCGEMNYSPPGVWPCKRKEYTVTKKTLESITSDRRCMKDHFVSLPLHWTNARVLCRNHSLRLGTPLWDSPPTSITPDPQHQSTGFQQLWNDRNLAVAEISCNFNGEIIIIGSPWLFGLTSGVHAGARGDAWVAGHGFFYTMALHNGIQRWFHGYFMVILRETVGVSPLKFTTRGQAPTYCSFKPRGFAKSHYNNTTSSLLRLYLAKFCHFLSIWGFVCVYIYIYHIYIYHIYISYIYIYIIYIYHIYISYIYTLYVYLMCPNHPTKLIRALDGFCSPSPSRWAVKVVKRCWGARLKPTG